MKLTPSLEPGSKITSQLEFKPLVVNQPVNVRAAVTYTSAKGSGDSAVSELKFRVALRTITFLHPNTDNTPDPEAFTKLLQNGDLDAKASVVIDSVEAAGDETSFSALCNRLCAVAHFQVIEKMAKSASLYSCSIQGHPIALLVKVNVSLDSIQ
jgi:AP-3 complex subunit delta-1